MSEKTYTFPGFVDVHVHFRDPGVPEAETTATGLAAAARGGFGAVVTMPNTTPACDSPEAIRRQKVERKGGGGEGTVIFPSACITKGRAGREVADLEALAEAGAAFFTDDGSYVADDKVMEEAMERVAALNMVVCQHAMDPQEQKGGVIRDCPLARKLNLPIISVETETKAIRRDLSLCRETGCRLHVQHISTAAGVALVRDAQKEGLPVTAEATPHHLLLTCDDIPLDDSALAPCSSLIPHPSSLIPHPSSLYKMAPPLGNREDRAELRKAVKDGVLMFATDHAPHPAAKKNLGFLKSANGIIGLETAIPITYAVMVEEEGMPVEKWAEAWWKLPRDIIGIGSTRAGLGSTRVGLGSVGSIGPIESVGSTDAMDAKETLEDLIRSTTVVVGAERAVDVGSFASLSRNCPYDGMKWRCWPCR